MTTAYTYDPLGQLIRVNDQNDTTSGEEGTTWTYEYDRGGNILNKKRYAYTVGTLPASALETVTYAYTDANWKDKLTEFNGSYITYDEIGNPTSDGEWLYAWEKGRQLKAMSKASETVVFEYNADGLRVKKTATSTGATHYTLHGKQITHLTNGQNTLHFYYDAAGKPAMVEYNGTMYAYVHNLQGDIVGILDDTGNEVVKYVYDAWGKPLSCTGTMAASLGKLNPFRYRGYVYDEETGLYYLRSRYYTAIWFRFLNTDTIMNGNIFSYCLNAPIDMIDKSGYACTYCGQEHIKMIGQDGDGLKHILWNGTNKRLPFCQHLDFMYQMYAEEWDYAPNDAGEGISYGKVDCTGMHRFPMYYYFSPKAYEAFHANETTVDGIYEKAVYNTTQKGSVIKGKGKITSDTHLYVGMALFREELVWDEKKKKMVLKKTHISYYAGDYYPGYTSAVIESVENGVVIRELWESEAENGPYTHCGFLRGIGYHGSY